MAKNELLETSSVGYKMIDVSCNMQLATFNLQLSDDNIERRCNVVGFSIDDNIPFSIKRCEDLK